MPNFAIQKYISEVKNARLPCFTTDTQVVCGRVVLTALPSIESESVHSYRLDLPSDVQLNEAPYWLLFIISIFDAQTFCDIQGRIRPAVLASGEYSEVIRGWKLRMFTEDGHRVVEATSTKSP